MSTSTLPTVASILDHVYRHFGVPPGIITDTKYRTPEVCKARRIAAYIAKKLTFLSNRQLADVLGVSQVTITNLKCKAQGEFKTDPELANKVTGIIADIEREASVQTS